MPARLSAAHYVDREFLSIRCRLIEIAAALDRIDSGEGCEAAQRDARLGRIREAARLLADESADRARRVQMLFSLPYQEDWRSE